MAGGHSSVQSTWWLTESGIRVLRKMPDCLMLYIFSFYKDVFLVTVFLSVPSPTLACPALEGWCGMQEGLLAVVSGQMCAHALLGNICKSGLSPGLPWHGITYLALHKNRTYPPVLYRLSLFNCYTGSTSKSFCKFVSPLKCKIFLTWNIISESKKPLSFPWDNS